MEAKITTSTKKFLVGLKTSMSLVNNQTYFLWNLFQTQRNEISNQIGKSLYSVNIYSDDYFTNFNPHNIFTKWTTVEVSDHTSAPHNMERLTLESGLYAMFHYKGLNTDTSIYQYIYSEWLPKSDYELDTRPHFEVLGEKYKNNSPDSEEEIWIPIKAKS